MIGQIQVWTEQDLSILLQLECYHRYDPRKWNIVARYFQRRTPRACKERFLRLQSELNDNAISDGGDESE